MEPNRRTVNWAGAIASVVLALLLNIAVAICKTTTPY